MKHLLHTLITSAAAITAAGVLGHYVAQIQTADRTVQVRGAAELPVQANLGTWTLNFSSSHNTLAEAQQQLNQNLTQARTFLISQGIPPTAIELQSLSVADAAANQYNDQRGPRFSISSGLLVRTEQLPALQKAKNALGKLVGQGVIITSAYGPNYAFTELNDKKPQLISQATAAAKSAATQFAQDSGARLGSIRRARQGSVEILGRDTYQGEAEQINKVLRVVTTVEYELK